MELLLALSRLRGLLLPVLLGLGDGSRVVRRVVSHTVSDYALLPSSWGVFGMRTLRLKDITNSSR